MSALAISPDGQTLATAGSDSLIHLWEIPLLPAGTSGPEARPISLKRKVTFKGHLSGITALAFSPDGQVLASASKDGTARFWTLVARREEQSLKGASSPLWFSPDSQRLLAANFIVEDDVSTTLSLSHWDLTSGKEMDRISIPLGTNVSFCRGFSPDGQSLALGMMHGAINLWSLRPEARCRTFVVCRSSVQVVSFAPSNDLLATAGMDEQTVKIWSTATMQEVVSPPGATRPMAFSPNGKMLATGGGSNAAILWDWATRQAVAILEGHKAFLNAVTFSPNGKLLATASEDNTIRLWDIVSGRMVGLPLGGYNNGIAHVVVSPDGKTLVSVTSDNEIKFWNLATGTELFAVAESAGPVPPPLFSPDGNLLALAANDALPERGEMKLWRAPRLEEIHAEKRATAEQEAKSLGKGSN